MGPLKGKLENTIASTEKKQKKKKEKSKQKPNKKSQNHLLPWAIISKCGCSAPGSLFSEDIQQHKAGLALEPLKEKCQDQAALKKG